MANYKDIIGKQGEEAVINQLLKLNLSSYIMINDGYFRLGRSSTQIDHLLITPHGIVVIETKNFAGKVVGKHDNKFWDQFTNSGTTRKITNPILQNALHVSAVKELLQKLGLEIPIYSCVVFTGTAEINVAPSKSTMICGLAEINSIIESALPDTITVSEQSYQRICNFLKASNITDEAERQKHLTKVKGIKSGKFKSNSINKIKKELKSR